MIYQLNLKKYSHFNPLNINFKTICGTIGSCQSAATSALLVTSLIHVSGAITSVLTFTAGQCGANSSQCEARFIYQFQEQGVNSSIIPIYTDSRSFPFQDQSSAEVQNATARLVLNLDHRFYFLVFYCSNAQRLGLGLGLVHVEMLSKRHRRVKRHKHFASDGHKPWLDGTVSDPPLL